MSTETTDTLTHTQEPVALQDWQLRVVEERAQLNERIMRLTDALNTMFNEAQCGHAIDEIDRRLLQKQRVYMIEYERILAQRVSRWGAQ